MKIISKTSLFISLVNLAVLGSLGVSCASNMNLAKSEKYERVEISQEEYFRPAFFYMDFTPSKSSRAPASVETFKEPRSPSDQASSKTTYFLGMWQQKLIMEKILGISHHESCPAFHNDLLINEKKLKVTGAEHSLSHDWKNIFSRGNVVSYPVLALPHDDDKDLYTFYQEEKVMDQEKINAAFEKLYLQTKDELQELCETGSSDGYFVYANMVEYHSQDEGFMYSREALKALLKVPAVSNFYVLHSLRKDAPVRIRETFFEEELLRKLNASWFQSYLYKIKKLGDDRVTSTKTGSSP